MVFKETVVDINKRQYAFEKKQASSKEKDGQGQQPGEYQHLKSTERGRR